MELLTYIFMWILGGSLMRIVRLAALFLVLMLTGCTEDKPALSVMEAYRLVMTPVEPSFPTHVLDGSSIAVKKQLDHNLLVYARKSDETGVYLGQRHQDGVMEYGEIGEEHYLADLTVTHAHVFDEDWVIVRGVCGAACMIQYLMKTDSDDDGYYAIYGGLQVADLDADGINELVVQDGAPLVEVTIYMQEDGQLVSASVNEAIGAMNGVRYNSEDQLFETYIDDRLVQVKYDKMGGVLLPVR
jgi:hypothetical protein